jgi:hypothetical protein
MRKISILKSRKVNSERSSILIVFQLFIFLDCPKKHKLWITAIGIVSSIIFIGILTAVIYKVILYLTQRHELARFNDDKKKANWEAVSKMINSCL